MLPLSGIGKHLWRVNVMYASLRSFLHICVSFSFLSRHSSLFKEAFRIFLVPFPQTPLIYLPCTEHTITDTLIYALGELLHKDTVSNVAEASWNVMAHTQKPDFVFRRNGRVHLNRRGRQFSQLLAVEVCASAVVMLDTPCSEVVRRVLATHSIRQFPLHFPYLASPCAITFQLESTCACRHKTFWNKWLQIFLEIYLLLNFPKCNF